MLKPLLLVSSSKPKEMKPLSLQSKLDKQELGAYSLSLFLLVFSGQMFTSYLKHPVTPDFYCWAMSNWTNNFYSHPLVVVSSS